MKNKALDALKIAADMTNAAEIFVLDDTDSTNSKAAQMLLNENRKMPFAVFARRQKSGRGRLGRSWFSAEGSSVCVSVAVNIPRGTPNLESFTVRAGLEICANMRNVFGADVYIKWPNDIYSRDGKKIAGMLAEMHLLNNGESFGIVFGIGVNYDLSSLDESEIPAEIVSTIADLRSVSQKDFSINRLAALLTDSVIAAADNMKKSNLSSDFSHFDWLNSKSVKFFVADTVLEGVARGIDDNGHLLLETSAGLKELHSGEATTHLHLQS